MLTNSIEKYSAIPLLLSLQTKSQHLAWATGFIAESPIGPVLITCRHVLTGRDNQTNKPLSKTAAIPDEVIIRHNGGNSSENISKVVSITQPLLDNNGKQLWFEHPVKGCSIDVVALPIKVEPLIVLIKSSLGVGDPKIICRPSEFVNVIGFPFGKSGPGQFAIWSTGSIASETSIPFDGLPVFLIDCRSKSGQSGAPVVAYRTTSIVTEDGNIGIGTGNAASRFLGVYSGRIHPDTDIGMVWSANTVLELVKSIKNEIGV